MKRHIRVAAAQIGGIQLEETRESVIDRMIVLLERAAVSGCQLIVFPELTLTTFFPRYWFDDEKDVDAFFETSMPGRETERLFERARELNIGFYLGYAERADDRRFNTSILVEQDGTQVGKYRKIHLPGHSEHKPTAPFQHLEKRYFEVGDLGFGVWPAFDAKIGMCICNDRRWPETFRVMALQGAEMAVLGFNTPTVNIFHDEPPHLRMFHHFISMQAAAYQNGLWIVASAKSGYEDGFRLHGGTCIIAPTGEVVAQTLTEDDELITYDCDLSMGEYIKNSVFNFRAHRRIDEYRLITERTAPDDNF